MTEDNPIFHMSEISLKAFRKEIMKELITKFLEVLQNHYDELLHLKYYWCSITTKYLDKKIEEYQQEIKKWEKRYEQESDRQRGD